MKLRFLVENGQFPEQVEQDLDKSKYDDLIKSQEILKQIYKHEELYDQVISTYLELKSAMYELSIASSVQSALTNRIQTYNNISKLNRLLFNTLNFGKMYLDEHYFTVKNKKTTKTKTYAFKITGCDNDNHELKIQREDIYRRNPYYVLGCDLRNHVQHASLPINRLTSGIKTENDKNVTTFYTTIKKEEIRTSNSNILEKFDQDIDLHEVIDGYVSAISEMHILSRSMIIKNMKNSLDLFKTTSDHLIKKDNAVGVIVVVGEKNQVLFQLGIDWFEVVNHLQIKNSQKIHLGNTFKHHPYKK